MGYPEKKGLLTGELARRAQRHLEAAVQEALQSPCRKSQRGVILAVGDVVIARGHNHPPFGGPCVPLYCRDVCAEYCVHAEMDALSKAEIVPPDAIMYHMRVKNGEPTAVDGSSCVPCAKHTERLFGIVLLENVGPVFYRPRTFHEEAMWNSGNLVSLS